MTGMSSGKVLPDSSSITIIVGHIIVCRSCYHTGDIAELLDARRGVIRHLLPLGDLSVDKYIINVKRCRTVGYRILIVIIQNKS